MACVCVNPGIYVGEKSIGNRIRKPFVDTQGLMIVNDGWGEPNVQVGR